MMTMYGFGWFLWATTYHHGGLNGSYWHNIWVEASKLLSLAPLTTIILTLVASYSYGDRAAVNTSWSGNATYENNIITASRNQDYLLFKSNDATPIPS